MKRNSFPTRSTESANDGAGIVSDTDVVVGMLVVGTLVALGPVVVLGSVKGTAFDSGHATLEASSVANKFWELFQGRSEASVNITA